MDQDGTQSRQEGEGIYKGTLVPEFMVILITGISSGFGRAMAERFAHDGHIVYGTHRKDVDPIPSVHYIKAESTVQEDVEAAVKQVVAEQGRIDVFVNNAGFGIAGPLEFCSVEECQRQMDVNFMGMVRYLREVVPVMRRQGGGHIFCMSSIGGLVGLPFQGMYSASKYAVEGYCEALRLEVRNFGITVTTIEPGDFATSFTAQRRSVDSSEVHNIYKSYARALEGIEHDENGGLKPEYLAMKMSRIVTRKRPRNHYIISTFVQRLSVVAKSILPSRWFALVMSAYYHV